MEVVFGFHLWIAILKDITEADKDLAISLLAKIEHIEKAKWAILDVGLASDIVLRLHLTLFHMGKASSFETKVCN